MADNLDRAVPTGTVKSVATDDVSDVHYQKVKLVDGTNNGTEGIPGSAADGLLVNLGTNNDVTVSGVATSAKQDTIIGHLDGLEGSVDGIEALLTTLNSLVDGLEALLTTIDSDTSELALALREEDNPHNSGHLGMMVFAVRQDTKASLADTDGDYLPLITDAQGSLWVRDSAVATTLTTIAGYLDQLEGYVDSIESYMDGVEALLTTIDGDTSNLADILTALQLIDNAIYTQGDTDASITGIPMLMEGAADTLLPVQGTVADGLLVNLGGNNDVTVTGSVTANAGTNLNTSALALEAGGNLAGAAASLAVIDDWDETDRAKVNLIVGQAGIAAGAGSVSATVPRVTHASDDPVTTAVQLIDDAIFTDDNAFTPATSKLMVVGAQADDTSPDSVDEGDAGALRMTLDRRLRTSDGPLPGDTWSYAAPAGGLVSTTAVTIKASAGGSLRNYLKSIQVINSHPTISTEITINDGAGGTVLHRGWAQAAGGGFTAVFDPPLRGTAATLLEVDEITGTATTGVLINAQGYVGL